MDQNESSTNLSPQSIDNSWGKKRYFIPVQIITATLGAATRIGVVRFLSINDLAAIGTTEAIAIIMVGILALGIGESLTRELAYEQNSQENSALMRWVFLFRSSNGLPILILLCAAAWMASWTYSDTRIWLLLLINIPLVWLRLFWRTASASIRGTAGFGAILLLHVSMAMLNIFFVLTLTFIWGIWGYFVAEILVYTIIVMVSLFILRDSFFKSKETRKIKLFDLKYPKKLFDISVLSYLNNLSNLAWKRLPLAIGMAFLPQPIIGAVAVAQSFSRRLQLFNQAVTQFLAPKLTAKFARSTTDFRKNAKQEVLQVFGLNVLLALGACAGWYFLGSLLIGASKWSSVGTLFYAYIAIQTIVGFGNILRKCIIIPTKQTKGLPILLVIVRSLCIPLLFILSIFTMSQRWMIPLSQVVPALIVTSLFSYRSLRILKVIT